jgi:CheY-like chemotaxis protein
MARVIRQPGAQRASGPSGPDRDDELLEIHEDGDGADGADEAVPARPWVVLIVDDDRGVHEATLLALKGARILGRPLRFLHAYSSAEAQAAVSSNAELSLILLDVVMETEDAGLRLVPLIRDQLKRAEVRIIIRTGQPGQAPEAEVQRNYVIDGYLMKSRLTAAMLLEAMTRALDRGAAGAEGAAH